MIRYGAVLKMAVVILLSLVLVVFLVGCGSAFLTGGSGGGPQAKHLSPLLGIDRYVENRLYDAADVFQIGVGVRSFEAEQGIFPPLVGAHVQVTDFLKLGSNSFRGRLVEWDGRGFYLGREQRTRRALGRWEMLRLEQEYDTGFENYFKKSDTRWADRMRSERMMWRNTPAKELNYSFWGDEFHLGIPPFHRGWQHWSHTGIEASLFPVTLRLGADFTESIDFFLGLVLIDTKGDDMRQNEYDEKRRRGPHIEGDSEPKPATKFDYLLSSE